MPVEHASWLIPAAKELVKNRKEILSTWDKIVALCIGKKSSIAFTGMSGVGKTVLLDALTGKGLGVNYSLPMMSEKAEKGKLSAKRQRIAMTVVPGQESQPRFEALDKVFAHDESVDGVIHVVSNGFVEKRDPTARQQLVDDGFDTLEKFRTHQLADELVDLNATCEAIRKAHRTTRKPRWMIVAVTKADLFYDQIDLARSYYSPAGKSAFVKRLILLQSQIGSDHFRWSALPVSSWIEDFRWNKEVAKSQLSSTQRNYYLLGLEQNIENYCGS